MARAITSEAREYVLECDRGLPVNEQTKFWVRTRTVDEVNAESAQGFNRLTRKKKDPTEKAARELSDNQAESFSRVVTKIENYFIPVNAIRGFFDEYKDKFEQVKEGDNVTGLKVNTEDADTIYDIYFIMLPNDSSEVLEFADTQTKMSSLEKN